MHGYLEQRSKPVDGWVGRWVGRPKTETERQTQRDKDRQSQRDRMEQDCGHVVVVLLLEGPEPEQSPGRAGDD